MDRADRLGKPVVFKWTPCGSKQWKPAFDYLSLRPDGFSDAGSDYGVSFPDFPGCVTVGRSLDEARQLAGEALALHIDGMIEDGDAVPRPSSLELIMADQINRDGVAVLVDAPMLADH